MEILIKNSEIQQLAARILSGVASTDEMSTAKLDDIYAIKTDTSAIHIRGAAAPVIKAGDGSRTRRFIASDETQDRMGDVIRVRGWKFDEFKKNPVALWGHDSDGFPIGKVHDWTQENDSGRPVLRESITYLSAEANPVGDAVLRMIDEGALCAVSVGFVPVRAYKPKNEAERKELGLGAYGVLYEEQQQLELSNCSIPANPNALLSKGAGDPIVAAMDDMVKRGKLGRALADELLRSVAKIVPARRTFALGAVEKIDQAELDATYTAWRESVNMSASELKAWDENECSRKASVDADAVIKRNLRLLETPKDGWDADLVADAKRTIAFIARMKNMEQGEHVSEACPISKRDISLKNWAYDPMKKSVKSESAPEVKVDPLSACVSDKIPKIHADHPEWKMDQVIAVAYSMCGEKAAESKSGCGCGCTQKAMAGELEVGDEVEWSTDAGPMKGVVAAIDMENAVVTTEAGESVTVPVAQLTKVEEPEPSVEIEIEVDAIKAVGSAITALDKRLENLTMVIEALEKRLDVADIAKASAKPVQATALRSSESKDAAAFFAQVAERVARSL